MSEVSEHMYAEFVAHEISFFKDLEVTGNGEASIESFLRAMADTGIAAEDSRVRAEVAHLRRLQQTRSYMTVVDAVGIFHRNVLIESAFRGRLVVPEFMSFRSKMADCIETAHEEASAVHGLSPECWAVAGCTIHGQRFSFGSAQQRFPIKEACKPILYAVNVEQHGTKAVHGHVDVEPSGGAYNERALASNDRPHNPYINAGAIMCAAMVDSELAQADRFDRMVGVWESLNGEGRRPGFNNHEFLKLRANADRDYCLGFMMREVNAFPEGTNLKKTLEFYFMNLCIEMNCDTLAMVAATLANGGVCPFSGSRVFSPVTVRHLLSLMSSCGMNDYSGRFQFDVGFPCKSGTSGVLLIVIPGLMGCASFAPEVNEEGNSIWGLGLCTALDRMFNFHLYGPDDISSRPGVDVPDSNDETETTSLLYAAAQGDLFYIRRMVAKGLDINRADYDLRTALHLAASENYPRIVVFLIAVGAVVNAVDRFGNTPLDDAKRLGHADIIRILENPPSFAVVKRCTSPPHSPPGPKTTTASDGDGETDGSSPVSRSTMMNGLKAFGISSASLNELYRATSVDDNLQRLKSVRLKPELWSKSLSAIDAKPYLQDGKVETQIPPATFENLLEVFNSYGLTHLLSKEDLQRRGELVAADLTDWTERYPFLENALEGKLVIPDWSEFCAAVERIYLACLEDRAGAVAQYIPQLAKVSPDKFGICVTSSDGQRVSLGDAEEDFCIQSCSKPITYCIAVENSCAEEVHKHVGREPSGKNFNELVMDKNNLPHNPLINAGAIMTCSLVKPEMSIADRFNFVCERWKECTVKPPRFSNATFLSERATADRNFCLAYLMKEKGAFPPEINSGEKLVDVLELYFQCCSIELNCEELSLVAATLANNGIHPFTRKRVFQESTVRNCLALMSSSGMYDDSGEFQFSIGLPCKSGVAGALLIVVPGVCGICTWSPRLNDLGNSVRGVRFCNLFSREFLVHMFDKSLPGMSQFVDQEECKIKKRDLRLHKDAEQQRQVAKLAYAASKGDIYEMKRLVGLGTDLNAADYDGRTALHLAASEGQVEVIRFMCKNGVLATVMDRWGSTPLDDARDFSDGKVADRMVAILNKHLASENDSQ